MHLQPGQSLFLRWVNCARAAISWYFRGDYCNLFLCYCRDEGGEL